MKKTYLTYTKAYEDSDCIGDEDAAMMVFNIDINDPESIGATLSSVLKKLQDEDFMEEVQEECEFPQFAIVKDDVAEELYFGSDEVYEKAAEYTFLHPLLRDICDEAASLNYCNSRSPLWEDDDNMLGVVPAFALAMADKEYVWTLTTVLTSAPNGDHSIPADKTEAMMKKWGACPETLMFFAALCVGMPLQGADWYICKMMEWGFEEYLKDDENMDDFLRSLYAYTVGNYFFRKGLEGDYWKNSFIKVQMAPVLRNVFHIQEEQLKDISEKIFDMVRNEEAPTIKDIRKMH